MRNLLIIVLLITTSCGKKVGTKVSSISNEKKSNSCTKDTTIPNNKNRYILQYGSSESELNLNNGCGSYNSTANNNPTNVLLESYESKGYLIRVEENSLSIQLYKRKINSNGSLGSETALGSYSKGKFTTLTDNSDYLYIFSDNTSTGYIYERIVDSDFNITNGTTIVKSTDSVSMDATSNSLWAIETNGDVIRSEIGNSTFQSDSSPRSANGEYKIIAYDIDSNVEQAYIIDIGGGNISRYRNDNDSTNNPYYTNNESVHAGRTYNGAEEGKDYIFLTDDTNDKLYTLNKNTIGFDYEFDICTGGKITSVDNDILAIQCSGGTEIHKFENSTLTKINDFSHNSGNNVKLFHL